MWAWVYNRVQKQREGTVVVVVVVGGDDEICVKMVMLHLVVTDAGLEVKTIA